MSGLLNSSLNGSTSNLPDGTGRSFATSFSVQSGVASPNFHHSGAIQGFHNVHGSFNVPNMPGTLTSRNSTINNVPSGGVQQLPGSLSSGRFPSNNLPVALSQLSHGISHGHSGVGNRGGISAVGNPGFSSSTNGFGSSIPGVLLSSAASGNRNAVPGFGVSPILENAGPRITSSVGNMVGGGNIGMTDGGLPVPGLASRLNLSANSGSASLGMQGQNRLMSGLLPQGSPQLISMLGNSYPSAGGAHSQSHVQAVSNLDTMGMLNDVNPNDSSPFDIDDFPHLTSRPNSAGGAQGQLGSSRKQGLGISSIVQPNQEFSIQNEDFPALPGFKGVHADYAMDMHQKEQLHDDNALPMMQSQHFSMGRSSGFGFGGTYPSHGAQQQQHNPLVSSGSNNQDFLHLNGLDNFTSSHSAYQSQTSGPPGIGLRHLNSPNRGSALASLGQLIQQYQQQQNQPPFCLQLSAVNQSFMDEGLKSAQSTPDPFGLLGLLIVIGMSDPDLTSLAIGFDLTKLGLNMSSSEDLHKTFKSPWADEPAKGELEFNVPQCYYAKRPPALNQGLFSKMSVETLFYIFYSMPNDEAQLYAANELSNRGWLYHKELGLWVTRPPGMEPLVKTNTYEGGTYHCFDPSSFKLVRRDNIVLHYEMLEKRPNLPRH